MTEFNVIIPSQFSGQTLLDAIQTVLCQEGLEQLIIADCGNAPSITARLQQMALMDSRLTIVTLRPQTGASKACNLAAEKATCDTVFFLRADCLLTPNVLKTMEAALNEAKTTMIVSASAHYPDGSMPPSLCHEPSTVKLALKRFLPNWVKRLRMRSDTPEVIPGDAVIGMRLSDFARLRGFDEAFGFDVACLDLVVRARFLGGQMRCIEELGITRLARIEAPKTLTKAALDQTVEMRGYYIKHDKGQSKPGIVPLVLALVFIRSFVFHAYLAWQRFFQTRRWQDAQIAYKRLALLTSGMAELESNNTLAKLTILVTGATSVIGLHVMRRLLASGAWVLALSHGDSVRFEHERLRWIETDLSRKDCNLGGYAADMAVHCAPLWLLPAVIPMFASAGIKRIVAFSSAMMFVRSQAQNSYEKALAAKLQQSEQTIAAACESHHIAYTLFRPTLIYGAGIDQGISRLYRLIKRFGRCPIYPPASGRHHPVHADDLALAVTQVITHPIAYGKTYNISGGEIVTWRETIERLFALASRPLRLMELPSLPWLLALAGFLTDKREVNQEWAYRMNDDLIFFHDAAARDFGFAPRAFLSGGWQDVEGW